ncbi:MAG TPA: exodeoxyribonuclease VII small subunit [Acidimicrobiales bacterium]|nr:exodeoxyribonuclease VII small subunit [Acidimicrobiales bacterium]
MTDPDDTEADAPAASYAEATAEIDAILTELERDDLDVDLLATKVRRAAELLTWCRGRIQVATADVAEAVHALDGEPVDTGEGPV